MSSVANKWKALQGEGHWDGLLEPLDEELCQELIRYGQFVQTVYDSFNLNSLSTGLGFSRYGKSELFQKLHVKPNYIITKFFYCSVLLESLLGKVVAAIYPFSGPTTSWFGYVAVSNDEETRRIGRRDIVIAFRGTQEDVEWANNLLNSFKASTGKPEVSEPMVSLVPLGAPADTTPVVQELVPVAEESVTTTTTVVAVAPAPAPAPAKKFGSLGGFIGGAVSSTGGIVSGVAGGVVSGVATVTTGVVSGVVNVAGQVAGNLPWQKALIGNRWLIPYASTNENERYGFGKKSARIQIMEALGALINRYKDEELSISVTGHSLGAAIATVCAYDIVNEKKNTNPATGARFPVTAFTFASPRVGNLEFRAAVERLSEQGLEVLRIANVVDLVPQVPLLLMGYVHCGHDFLLNSADSKYLKFPTLNIGDPHNLQAYLHLINNKLGTLKYHQLELVNKSSDSLRDSAVPGNWWVTENTDVVFNEEEGKWELRGYKIALDNEDFN